MPNVSTALVTNPVLIFFIVLTIILMAPLLLNRLKIPHIIGMIVAGVCVGPYGFHLLDNDASFSIFGQVGLLYLMFLAGIEIDLYHLRRNLRRGLTFGVLTFMLPLVLGVISARYWMHTDMVTAVLLASMYASHTLIAYPVAVRFGITKAPSVLIAIVGTIVAVIGALLTLAAAVHVHHTGVFSMPEMLLLIAKLAGYAAAIYVIYPRLTRRFLRRYSDRVTQFVYILALVFLAAWAAQAIGLEAVLGAFYAGLVLNRFVPNASPLMSRLEFVGNALFIPYFLIGVGMMIDVRVISQRATLLMAADMLLVALAAKWLAAWITQKLYGMRKADRRVMFGLTTAHTAVALAVVTIGYNFGLMDRTMLNGTVLMILISCAMAPIITAGAARQIKIRMLEDEAQSAAGDDDRHKLPATTLVPVDNPVTALALMELANLVHPADNPGSNLLAVHVRTDNSPSARANCQASLQMATDALVTVDVKVTPIERFDMNIASGLLNIINERDVNCVVMGLHRKTSIIDTFFGSKMEQILRGTPQMIILSRNFNPLNTLRRLVVFVPAKAEFEVGFRRWVITVGRLARNLGSRLIFLCGSSIRSVISGVLHSARIDDVRCEYRNMEDWGDFVLLGNRILDDDLLIVVSARRGSLSFSADVENMPGFLQKYFSQTNLMIIFPEQGDKGEDVMTFVDPTGADVDPRPSIWRRCMMALSAMRRRHRTPRIPPEL
jgi:Kef-type K+ transport system membrane component KefB/nucleotide-binding universal stress UspA family protein